MQVVIGFVLLLLHVVFCNGQCPLGWQAYIGSTKCIQAYPLEMSFIDALEYCMKVGGGFNGTLVSIHNAFQNAKVATAGQDVNNNCAFWIGLYDFDSSGTYTWSDGSVLDYTNWTPECPPENPEGSAVYMALNEHSRWACTGDISQKSCFVCQIDYNEIPVTTTVPTTTRTTPPTTTTPPLTTTYPFIPDWHCSEWACYFYVIDGESSQPDAEATCEAHNSTLVSILDEEEEDYLEALVPPGNSFWIGASQYNGTWYWLDGSTYNYTNWYTNQPDSSHKCALKGYDRTQKWGTWDCGWWTPFVCKYKKN